jgi:hypothetical protein
MALTHYIIVRKDMPTGAACAQITHAAGESFFYYKPKRLGLLEEGTVAVVLGVENQNCLKYYAKRLRQAGIKFVMIRENEGPLANQVTAIGVVPTEDRETVRAVLKRVPLLDEFN